MSNLNLVDIFILAIFFFSIMTGFARGFIREAVSLLTLIAAFIIAIMFTNPLAHAFTSSSTVQTAVSHTSNVIGVSTETPVSYLALGVSFALLFIATMIVGSIISYLLNVVFETGFLGFGNRLLGGVFGLVRGFIINLVLIFVVQLTSLDTEPWWVHSRFVEDFQPAVQRLGALVSPSLANLKQKFNQTLEQVNTHIQGVTK